MLKRELAQEADLSTKYPAALFPGILQLSPVVPGFFSFPEFTAVDGSFDLLLGLFIQVQVTDPEIVAFVELTHQHHRHGQVL